MPKDEPKAKKQKRPADEDEDDDDDEEDFVGGDDDDDDDDDDEVADDDDDDDEEEEEGGGSSIQRNDKGEGYFELSTNRRLTISTFRNQIMIDLREFYEKDGKQNPGKKGLSLTVDQYESLKALIMDGSIDREISSLKKK